MSTKNNFINSIKYILANTYENNVSDMAKALDMHRNQISRYISGATCPSLDTLDDLAHKLKIDPLDLVRAQAQKPSAIDPSIEARLAAHEARLAAHEARLAAIETKAKQTTLIPSTEVERVAQMCHVVPPEKLPEIRAYLEAILDEMFANPPGSAVPHKKTGSHS